MSNIIVLAVKIVRKPLRIIRSVWDGLASRAILLSEGVVFSSVRSRGVPKVDVSRGGRFSIGPGFAMNNGIHNPIGRPAPCVFFVGSSGELRIGSNVGMSSVAIVAWNRVVIEDGARIGGGACIYDTDFHSLSPSERLDPGLDRVGAKTSPVHLGRNCFVGAHAIVLKGVRIGDNSVIGAASVVTRDVPPNQIWAGNPARFIRELKDKETNPT